MSADLANSQNSDNLRDRVLRYVGRPVEDVAEMTVQEIADAAEGLEVSTLAVLDAVSPDGDPTAMVGDALDPAGYETPEEWERRQGLNLRPIAYLQGNPHPDRRDCPAWCRCADNPDLHTVKPRFPSEANHVSDVISTLVEYYAGTDDGNLMVGCQLNVSLSRRGDSPTLMRLEVEVTPRDTRRLTLTLDDAQDLVTVMTYLLGQANAAELLERGGA